jgi:predicted nucleic acid-binding protein
MNVVDSSAWIAYLTAGPNAAFFAKPIEATNKLIVPVLVLYEVFKRIHRERDEAAALETVAHMMQGRVVDLTANLALEAAELSIEKKLPMADAMILATAQAHDAILWTQDSHFEGIPKVEYRPAKGR